MTEKQVGREDEFRIEIIIRKERFVHAVPRWEYEARTIAGNGKSELLISSVHYSISTMFAGIANSIDGMLNSAHTRFVTWIRNIGLV